MQTASKANSNHSPWFYWLIQKDYRTIRHLNLSSRPLDISQSFFDLLLNNTLMRNASLLPPLRSGFLSLSTNCCRLCHSRCTVRTKVVLSWDFMTNRLEALDDVLNLFNRSRVDAVMFDLTLVRGAHPVLAGGWWDFVQTPGWRFWFWFWRSDCRTLTSQVIVSFNSETCLISA